MEVLRVHTVRSHVQQPGSARATLASSAAVALLGTTHSAARRSATRDQPRKKRALNAECSAGAVKNVASCSVTTGAAHPASGRV